MNKTDILTEVQKLIDAKKFFGLREYIVKLQPTEIAEIIIAIPSPDDAILFRLLPQKIATEVFEFLDIDTQKVLLDTLTKDKVSEILNEMSPDDRTTLLEELPSSAVTQLLGLLSFNERAIAQTLLGYPEDSIGRLMTPEFIAVREEWTVQETLDYIRSNGKDSETLNVIYIVRLDNTLIGDMRIRELLLSPLDTKISSLMTIKFVTLNVNDNEEAAISVFKKNDRVVLPVTDTRGALIGIVTIDDVLRVAEETSTESMHRFGGTQVLDEPYISTAIIDLVKKRMPWLAMLFISEMLTTEALSIYEHTISQVALLAVFIPLIISSGGNSGSQAATLVIRSISVGEITLKDWFKIMKKEIVIGLILGTVLGIIGFIRASYISYGKENYHEYWPLIGLTIGFSLIGIVLWGTLIGSMFPFILKKLKQDPAISSGPFVATFVDVTGIIIYFTMATFFLKKLLG